MATPRTPNQKKQYARLNARLLKYGKHVERLYETFNREAAQIAMQTDYTPDTGKMFRFKDFPQTREDVKKIMSEYSDEITATIHSGTSKEWAESNAFQDLLARQVLRAYGVTNSRGEKYQKYFQNNSDQLQAFQQRKTSGMNLSKRIWNLRQQYRQELEMGLSVGIERGISANELASKLSKYQNNPGKLFRRVRDKYGNLQLSKNARTYHPGRGVYRSSFKNALRLTRSEINMAYRTAEQTRWQQFDFVVGYEIKLSQRHPYPDVCDDLAGKYPKDFKWTGWHPNDMCYCVSILKTTEEFASPDDDTPSVNAVTDMPDGFKEWVRDNEDRIKAANKRGTQPYFIRDNKEYIDNILNPSERESDTNISKYELEKLSDSLGLKHGIPMTFEEANEMRANPQYKRSVKYRQNCQSSVVANELRRLGFDVEAYGNTKEDWYMPSILAKKPEIAFMDAKGDPPIPIQIHFKGDLQSSLNGEMKDVGRYHLRFRFNNTNTTGHIITAERLADGSLRIYDPQNGKIIKNFNEYSAGVRNDSFEYYRVDNLRINAEVAKGVVKLSGSKGDAPRMNLPEIKDFLEKGWYGDVSKQRLRDRDAIRDIQARWNDRKAAIAEQTGEHPSLIIDPNRRVNASINKREQLKFEKEYRMGETYSKMGHKVEILEEIPGVSSPDAIIDGIKVDFKSLSSANNIERHAKDAIFKQGADEVWFEFTQKNGEILNKIEVLQEKGIHGRYYFKGENKEYRF